MYWYLIFKADREPTEERSQLLKTVEDLLKKEEVLKKEMQKYRDSDPEYINQLKTEMIVSSIIRIITE